MHYSICYKNNVNAYILKGITVSSYKLKIKMLVAFCTGRQLCSDYGSMPIQFDGSKKLV
jgi:hypothetical protein